MLKLYTLEVNVLDVQQESKIAGKKNGMKTGRRFIRPSPCIYIVLFCRYLESIISTICDIWIHIDT